MATEPKEALILMQKVRAGVTGLITEDLQPLCGHPSVSK
jgi:hypothetical protein